MTNSQNFKKELEYITNNELREFVAKALDNLPDYFRHIGASTSGKYHPSYTLGEGGLVRHTKAAVGIAKDLLRAEIYSIPVEDYDVVFSSLIMHDGLKCGMWEDKTAFNHPILMSEFLSEKAIEYEYTNCIALSKIKKCIESHMGKWNTFEGWDLVLPKPRTDLEKIVHLSDYIASRKNLEFKFDVEGSVGI